MTHDKPVPERGPEARPNVHEAARPADADRHNFFEAIAPAWFLPYGQLARFDRPIGAWLLLFPCWWSQSLAEIQLDHAYPNLWFWLLFLVGAFVMRGAGCAYNDFIDRDIDRHVARTAGRPIPSGRVSPTAALVLAAALSTIGLVVLLQFNTFTIWLGIASLALVAVYPFAKRFTNWPQLVLGLTFKWGALVGFAATAGTLGWPAALLYIGCIAWTVGYDTIYAHQDRTDDSVISIKSTARLFDERTHAALTALYAIAIVFWTAAAIAAGAGWPTYTGLFAVMLHFIWQVSTLDIMDGANCLERFKSNRIVGWLFLTGMFVDIVFA